MSSRTLRSSFRILIPLVGGAIGAALGYLIFSWALSRGLIPMAIPGGLIGVGAGILKGPRVLWPAIVCGVAGLLWGAFCYWKFLLGAPYPFRTFLAHPQDLPPFHLVVLGLGALVAFWVPFRRRD